jgi:hypothetical protein
MDVSQIPVLTAEDFRRRHAWASRRGLRWWLWPDVEPAAWSAALSQICAIVRDVMSEGASSRKLEGDAAPFSVAAYTSGMGPLLGFWLQNGRISAEPDIAAMLGAHLSHNRLRMEMLLRETLGAVERLAAARIGSVIIKGMHTAFDYFPAPETRPVTDVDIVVQPQDISAAEAVLQAAGYVARPRLRVPYQCDWTRPDVPEHPLTLTNVHCGDPWAFDLQTTFNRHLTGAGVVDIDRLIDERALRPWTPSSCARVLQTPELVVHLAAHASQNIINLNLLRLTEIALVAKKDGARCWEKAPALLERIGPRHVYPALSLCERLLPGTVPADILMLCEQDAPARLCRLITRLDLSALQMLDRHSLGARYMWSSGALDYLRQVLSEFVPYRTMRPYQWPAFYFERVRAVCRIR